jgi:hypothetical protein
MNLMRADNISSLGDYMRSENSQYRRIAEGEALLTSVKPARGGIITEELRVRGTVKQGRSSAAAE